MLFKKLGADCVVKHGLRFLLLYFSFTGKNRKFILSDFRSSVLFDTPSLEVIKQEKGFDSV